MDWLLSPVGAQVAAQWGLAGAIVSAILLQVVGPWFAQRFAPGYLLDRQRQRDEREQRQQDKVAEAEERVWARVNEQLKRQDDEIVKLRSELDTQRMNLAAEIAKRDQQIASLTAENTKLQREIDDLRRGNPSPRRGLHP